MFCYAKGCVAFMALSLFRLCRTGLVGVVSPFELDLFQQSILCLTDWIFFLNYALAAFADNLLADVSLDLSLLASN